MKFKKLVVSSFLAFSLTGCQLGFFNSANNSTSNNVTSSSSSSKYNPIDEFLNSSKTSSNTSSKTSSNSSKITGTSSSSTSKEDGKETVVLDIYASNDIHGRVSENASINEPGIAKLSTYLSERKAENPDGYIYINSGDYWQDTYESSYNKGSLLTECLDLMECEVLALGNHEFDEVIEVI